jgi:hypothetical protein
MGLIGSFFGRDQKKDLQAAKGQADAALAQGYNSAYGDYTNAMQSFDPYVQSGQQANTFYNDALGLNGDTARGTAVDTLTSNPLFQGQLGQESNAMSRVLNAQGASGGGKAQLAAQRVFQQNAGSWLDRYANQGAQGLQATGAQAGMTAARGDLSYGYGATRAGNEVNYGNAMAANRSTGINNLMGVASLAVNAMKPTPKLG